MQIDIVWLVGLFTLFVLVTLLVLVVRKRLHGNKQLFEATLNVYRQDEMKRIIIPDGIGGLLEVEQLILTPYGLLLIESYDIEGHLYGSDAIDQWTQIIKGRSYQFANPLRHIKTARQALMTLVPELPIFYRVVIKAAADFPKGKPEGIVLVKELNTDLELMMTKPVANEQLQAAWLKLARIARKDGQAIERGEYHGN